MLEVPGHAEMNKEVPPALELDNQILAAPTDVADTFTLERGCDRLGRIRAREPGVGDDDPVEPATGQARGKPGPDRLDFGELGHVGRLPFRR